MCMWSASCLRDVQVHMCVRVLQFDVSGGGDPIA